MTRVNGSLWQRLTSGAGWSLAGALASQGFGQVAFLAVARQLNVAGCGALGIVTSTVGVLGLVAGMGMGLTSTKSVAGFRLTAPLRAGRTIRLLSVLTLITAGVTAIAAYFTAGPIAAKLLGAPALTRELRIASLLLLFNTVNGVQTGVLTGLEAFRRNAVLNLVKGILVLPCVVLGAREWNLTGAVWGYVVAAGLGCGLNRMALRRQCILSGIPLGCKGAWEERRVIWEFAAPTFLGGVAFCVASWVANALLVNQPHGYEMMGLFAAADKWRLIIAFVPSATAAGILSLLANEAAKPGRAGFRRVFWANLAINSAITLPAVLLVELFPSRLMGLAGESFRQGSLVLSLVALSTIPSLLNVTLGQLLLTGGRVWQRAFIDVLLGILLLVAAIWLVPRYGAVGLAAAYLGAYSVAASILFAYVYVTPRIGGSRRIPALDTIPASAE